MQRSTLILFGVTALVGCSGNDAVPSQPGSAGAASAGAGAVVAGSLNAAAGKGGTSVQGGAGGTPGGAGGPSGGSAEGGSAPAGGSSVGGAAGSVSTGGAPALPDVTFCTAALDAAAVQLVGFRSAYTNPASVPRSAKGGTVANVGRGDWTFGFVGGSYWYLYEYTKDEAFRTAAVATQAALEPQKDVKTSHDLGFEFMSTFGNGYRLTKTVSYLSVLKTAAASLATRFRAPVGAIQSWDRAQWDCPVIIDNMMNLHLLYFVSQNGGDASYATLANQHAATTLKNHFRADDSSFHLVNYDSTTGAVLGKQTVQGFADTSAWARGQSWGLYGYTESFVLSRKPEFLAQAQKIAEYLLAHENMPADKVPYWDYDAPDSAGAPKPRDASAAAIMASALLQLSGLVAEPAATKYRDFALDVLKSLSSPAYAAASGANSHFLLMHSTGHLPANTEIDAAINYADYYYLEALLRCRALATP